ncbi:MAG: hypothetical protein R2773_03470 [Flavobacteriaceae bacterium]
MAPYLVTILINFQEPIIIKSSIASKVAVIALAVAGKDVTAIAGFVNAGKGSSLVSP